MLQGRRWHHRRLAGPGRRGRGKVGRRRLKGANGAQRQRPSSGSLLEELSLSSRGDGPVVALARVTLGALLLDEGLVEAQVVADAVLPACLHGSVVEERMGDPLVDLGQGQAALGSAQDGHADQHGVAVLWLVAIILDGSHLLGGWNVHRKGQLLLLLLLLLWLWLRLRLLYSGSLRVTLTRRVGIGQGTFGRTFGRLGPVRSCRSPLPPGRGRHTLKGGEEGRS